MRWSLFVVLLAGSAHAADLVPLTETRTIYLEAYGNSDFGGDQSQAEYSSTDDGGDPFLDWGGGDNLASNGAQSAIASASGNINTFLGLNSLAGVANVTGTATIFDETGYDAFAQGRARMDIGFSLDSAGMWSIDSTLAFAGTGSAEVRLSEGLLPGGNVLYLNNSAGSASHVLALGPGEYTISFYAQTTNWILAQGTLSGSASFDASMTLVPAPATIALVAAAPTLTRRRRR